MSATLSAPLPFVVGNVPVRLQGDAARLDEVRRQWERVFVAGAEAGGEGVTVHLGEEELPHMSGEEVYAAAALHIFKTSTGFFLRCGDSSLVVTPGASGRLYLAPDFGQHTLFERREFFLLGLLMLLRPFGLYGLHACGLRRDDPGFETGLLVVGASGAGKTTTTLNLMRCGWTYLSDDAVLLREAGGGVEALAFRKGFSCTPQTLAAFPDLCDTVELETAELETAGFDTAGFDTAEVDAAGKRLVSPGAAYGGFVPRCTPRLVLFPKLGAAQTELRPLANPLALVRLSQQSAGIMTDRRVSRAQLELLKQLVLQARCFELRLGEDALQDSARVNELLEAC